MRVRRDLIRHVTTHQFAQSNFNPSLRAYPHASRIYVNLSAINRSTDQGAGKRRGEGHQSESMSRVICSIPCS